MSRCEGGGREREAAASIPTPAGQTHIFSPPYMKCPIEDEREKGEGRGEDGGN